MQAKIEIRRQDGSVEDVVRVNGQTPEDLAAELHFIAPIYAGTGFTVVVVGLGPEEIVVGQFGSGSVA